MINKSIAIRPGAWEKRGYKDLGWRETVKLYRLVRATGGIEVIKKKKEG